MNFSKYSNRTKALAVLTLGLGIASAVSYVNDKKNISLDNDIVDELIAEPVKNTITEVVDEISNPINT